MLHIYTPSVIQCPALNIQWTMWCTPWLVYHAVQAWPGSKIDPYTLIEFKMLKIRHPHPLHAQHPVLYTLSITSTSTPCMNGMPKVQYSAHTRTCAWHPPDAACCVPNPHTPSVYNAKDTPYTSCTQCIQYNQSQPPAYTVHWKSYTQHHAYWMSAHNQCMLYPPCTHRLPIVLH